MDSTLKDEKNVDGEFKDMHDVVPVLRSERNARQDEIEVNLEKFRKEYLIDVLDGDSIDKWMNVLDVIASKFEDMFENKHTLEMVLYGILLECVRAKRKITENAIKCIEALDEEKQIEKEKIKMYLDAQQTVDESLEDAKKSQDEKQNNVLDENPIENWDEVLSPMTKMESEMDLSDNKVLEYREATRKIQENIVRCVTACYKEREIEIMKPKATKLYLTIKFDGLARRAEAMLECIENRKLEDLPKIFKLQLKLKEKKEQSSMEKEELELISYQREIKEIEAEISEMKKTGELLEWGIAKYKEKLDRLNEGKKFLTKILGKVDIMQIPKKPEITSNSLLFLWLVNQPKPTEECHAGSSQAAKNVHDMKDLESEKATPTPSGECEEPTKNRFKKQKLH